jgi:hypothetical protein
MEVLDTVAQYLRNNGRKLINKDGEEEVDRWHARYGNPI